MELIVEGADGLPEGCLISIRAGAHRRQAAADNASAPFKFPTGAASCNPFRMDILQPVGTSRLMLRPGEEKYTVPIESADGSQMSVTFRVKEEGLKAGLENDPTLKLSGNVPLSPGRFVS